MHIYRPEGARIPIKVWMSREEYEALGVKEQAEHLAMLPFAFHHIALMPDAHVGYGMPIGGVLAAKGYVVPNAVGVDIGCGMRFVHTDIDADEFLAARTKKGESLLEAIIADIGRRVPVGFAHHSKPQDSQVLSDSIELQRVLESNSNETASLLAGLEEFQTALGTLGGGNHFIEIQCSDDSKVCIMIHTGSRNLGKAVCDTFNKAAVRMNGRYFSQIPRDWDLAFLPLSDSLGDDYLRWMFLAQAYAKENRQKIMDQIKASFHDLASDALKAPVAFSEDLDVHHNYATWENHFGENVLVHRKGAILARQGMRGIIPGAMGTPSYIVEGLGNPESFTTASHGAGRKMSRRQAMQTFKPEDIRPDFVLSTESVEDVLSEWKEAYKNIDDVLANEADLVRPVLKVTTLGVIKAKDDRR